MRAEFSIKFNDGIIINNPRDFEIHKDDIIVNGIKYPLKDVNLILKRDEDELLWSYVFKRINKRKHLMFTSDYLN